MKALRFLGIAGVTAGVISMANADGVLGGGLYYGMAGAGIAMPVGGNGRLNPALYSFAKRGFGAESPQFGYRLSGVNLKQLQDNLKSVSNGGLDSSNLSNLAKQFGAREVQLGGLAGLQLNVGQIFIAGSGEVLTKLVPNAGLMADVNAGGGSYNAADQLDGYGFGYYSIDVAMADKFKFDAYGVNLGARARIVKGYYSHQFVDGAAISSGGSAAPGSEMGGANVLNKSGLGLDIGGQLPLDAEKKNYAGFVVENLVKPKVSFDATLPVDIAGPTKISPFSTKYTVGIASQLAKGVWFAGDYYDVTKATTMSELRFGLMTTVIPGIGLQVGNGGKRGFAFGVAFLGVNLSFQKNVPMTASTGFKF